MKPILSIALASLCLAACATAPAPAHTTANDTGSPTVDVMVLGVYHFANPGLDVVNTKVDDVLVAKRQAELEALADRLAKFRPTAIAVEVPRPADGLLDPGYAEFKAEDLSTRRNEVVQIGYRLAHKLGIDRVYAVDENAGEIPFFPFDRVQAFAERTGQMDRVNSLIAEVQAESAEQEEAQETQTVSQLLARHNDPDTIVPLHRKFYYGLLELSDAEDRAGAVLNYGWYARNALIFANLTEATEPGDRVLVIYGSGHAYWLRHFAEETPGYRLVEALPYLTDQTASGS